MKKFLALTMILVLGLAMLAGCSSTAAPSEAESTAPSEAEGATPSEAEDTAPSEADATNTDTAGEGGYVIGFSPPTMNNPFFAWIESNVRKEVEGRGDTLITVDPQNDAQKQISQVEDLLTQNIDLLLLCPRDSASIKTALVACSEKNVPIVIFDTEVLDPEYVVTSVVSDNVNAGYVVGLDMKEKLPEGSKVAILHSPAAQTCVQRVEGFKNAVGDYFDLVAELDGQGDTGITMPVAEDILQGNPDLAAFFAINDPSAIGCVQALESANKTGQVIVYGVDGAPEAKAAIKAGQMEGTGAQSPANIGSISVEYAYKHLAGESVETLVYVPTFIINKENIDEYGTEGWQ